MAEIKPYHKYEIAQLYGVSLKTLAGWIKRHENGLIKLHYSPQQKVLTVAQVKFLFDQLGHP